MKTRLATTTALTLAALTLLSAPLAQAAPLFQQQVLGGSNVGSSWTSHFGIGQGGFQTLDDFKLAGDAQIDRVRWHGIYISSNSSGFANATPNTDSWTVEFWSGDANGPTTRLYTAQVGAAAVQRTSTGTRTFANTQVDEFDFTLDLATPFDVDGGETYWFSVVSQAPSFAPFFSWTQAEGAGITSQTFIQGNGEATGFVQRFGDRAFALEGQAVPEPGTVALMLAALGIAGWQRRRSH